MFYQSFGLGGWLERGVLLAATTAALLLSASALMSGQALPTFVELIGPRHGRTRSLPTMMLGFTLIVITLIATETALNLVFDARWRDFPFASLTMAAVPIWILASLNRPKSGPRPIAEAVFTGLFVIAAIYIAFNEGADNWQALWTAAAYVLFGATLWRAALLALGVTAFAAWSIGARLALAARTARIVEVLAALELAAYAVIVIAFDQRFLVAIANYAPAVAFLAVSFLVAYRRQRSRPLLTGLAGLLLTAAAAVVQRQRIALHPTLFNHNALYHAIQMVAFVLIFQAGRYVVATPAAAER